MHMNDLVAMEQASPLAASLGGVLTTRDLGAFFGVTQQSSLQSRLRPFLKAGILTRIQRGIYVWREADPRALARRLCPDATRSFGNVLAEHLLIGTVPTRQFLFTASVRDLSLTGPQWTVGLHRLSEHLQFGWDYDVDGYRAADPEKAVLDCLHYRQRGLNLSFDVETDIDRSGLDRERFLAYVERYPNPRFQSRCRRWLDAV